MFLMLLLMNVNLVNDALKFVGQDTTTLGYTPKGYWSRYPNNKLIPYKLPFFDDLFSNPLQIYVFGRTMGNVVEDYLDTAYCNKHSNSIYEVLYFNGVDKMLTGFRNYSANLSPITEKTSPLFYALNKFIQSTSRQENFQSFGGKYDTLDMLFQDAKKIPLSLQTPIAELILNLLDALRWRNLATKNVPVSAQEKLFSIRNWDETQSDGAVYYPSFDDVGKTIDLHSLFYAGLKTASAVEKAADKLDSILYIKRKIPVPDVSIDIHTRAGRIIIGGRKNDTYKDGNILLLIDFGGNDTYYDGCAGTSSLNNPISVVIDLSGNDTYIQKNKNIPSFGGAILGVAVNFDVRGNDIYKGKKVCEGTGIYGVGILYDRKGKDRYTGETMAQGCGYRGIGMLLDIEGNDNYYIYGNGQGDGEMGGIGIIADRYGNDYYKAEPLSSVFDRGDYHSKHKINGNNAQGFGGGRRGDGSDGHSWSGGLGVLIDIAGNDKYEAGNWAQGVGYWYGTGILYDKEGNDVYKSCYFTQASAAHYAIGAIIDESGNDKHILFETGGAGLAFGWDFTDVLFVDKSGNDRYEGKIISIGVAEIRSNAIFLDLGGNDYYKMNKNTLKYGASDYRKGYKTPNRYSPFGYFTNNIGIFIDKGGKDTYKVVNKNGKIMDDSLYINNSHWLQPAQSDSTYGYRNYGIGIDTDLGEIPVMNLFDK